METERELGELLVLMVGAHRSFRSLRAEVRTWHHLERSHEASMRQQERRGGRGSLSMASVSGENAEPPPDEMEDHLRIWLERPDRLREESVSAYLGKRVESTLVQVGDTWWAFHTDMGAQTNGGSSEIQYGSRLQRAMLDPAELFSWREFEIVGRTVHAGRPAICVAAHPSPRDVFLAEPHGGFDACPQELVVDAERGILLRSVSLLDGEPFAIVEFLSIAFDEEIPDEIFVFEPPPGEEVRDAREAMLGHLGPVPLHEAAQRAPFAVLVPAAVPADWRMHVYFSEEDERRRWPAAVHIHYVDDMARVNINVNEHAAGDEGLPPTAPDGGEWRVEELENGELRLWEPSEPERGMPRLAITEVAGTRIQISTNDLAFEEIIELAASLVPAPTDPPAIG
jgi:outer membrane lipoprotein-sorting protein